jgi:reverse transcriptase-like protein
LLRAAIKEKVLTLMRSSLHKLRLSDYIPLVRHTSIRVLLALVAMFDMELEQPDGFLIPGKENLLCRLKKSLYGLKQAPRQWYKGFDSFMIGQGYTRSQYDHCVYFKQFDGVYLYLLLYVDDMLIASRDKSLINNLKSQLSKEFEMKDLGAARKILGMEIHRDRQAGKFFLSKKRYIEQILDRFSMKDCKSVSTPLAAHFKISSAFCPHTEDMKSLKRSLRKRKKILLDLGERCRGRPLVKISAN